MDESEDYESLTELIFTKNSLESADFEIAFTATLATIVLASASATEIPPIVLKITSISLITTTLIRRMAVSSRFADESQILSLTMLPIEFLTTIVLFYIFYSPAQFISEILPVTQGPLVIASLLIPEIILVLIVVEEIVFKDYMIWWAGFALGQAQNTKNRILTPLWGFIALSAFKSSLIKELPDELGEMQEFVDYVLSEIEAALSQANEEYEQFKIPISAEKVMSTWQIVLFSSSLFILGSVFLLLTFVLSIVFGSLFELFLLIFSVVFIRHIVRFYYLAYGLPDESQFFNKNALQMFILYSVYVFGLYSVFSFL